MRPLLRPFVLALALAFAALPAARAQVVPAPTGAVWDLVPALVPAAAVADPLPGEVERFLAALDEAAFVSEQVRPGDAVSLALPGGARAFTVTRVTRHRPGTVSLTAVAADGSGELAALTYDGEGVLGTVSEGDALFQLFSTAGRAVMARMDPAGMDVLACGVDGHAHAPAPPGQAGRAAMAHAGPSMPTMTASVDDPITLDLLIPYTANAAAWATESGSTIDAVIAQALNLSQLALDNSNTGIRLRVVHAYQTGYDDATEPPTNQEGGASTWHLYRLTASSAFNPWGANAAGFLEEVHTLRDTYGADLVAMFARVSDVGGIAWLLNTIAGRPELGFSVNRVQQVGTGYTLVHEIGHNLGNSHGRDQPSAEAPARGGLFAYSVGWRWTGDEDRMYHSVMSYGQPGDIRTPHFSNPDISYLGGATGAYSGDFAPADAARSMREVKRVVASYRPTRVSPPAAAADGPIALEVFRNETATRTLTVRNTGATDLVWELDLVPAPAAPPADASASRSPAERDAPFSLAAPSLGGEGAEGSVLVDAPGNLSPGALVPEGDLTLIYATTFSAQQGFALGDHLQRELWTSRNDFPFAISDENPSRDDWHLRLRAPGDATTVLLAYSPYFGAWPTGRYELSMDVAISARNETVYFIPFLDGRSGGTMGGFAFAGNGQVLAYNPQLDNYTAVGRTWEGGEYRRYTVVIDPEAGRIRYLIGPDEVADRPAPASGIGQFYVARNPAAGTDHIDIDDISYQSLYLGLEWARPDRLAGVTPPGGQTPVTITFPGEDVEPGTYRAEAVLRTNDPASPSVRIPLALDVSTLVDAEEGAMAERTRLLGNRPNPFSAATRVAYVLAAPAHVTLEVFTVTGQRVAVLADAYQPAGTYEHAFETEGLASGLYLYRLRAGDTVDTGRMLLVR